MPAPVATRCSCRSAPQWRPTSVEPSRAAEDRAGQRPFELHVVERRARRQPQRLGLVVVDAKCVREIRIGGGQRHDRVEQVDQRATEAAARDRNPQHAQRRAPEDRESFERQFATRLALRGIVPDRVREIGKCGERIAQRVARIDGITGGHSVVPCTKSSGMAPRGVIAASANRRTVGTAKYRDAPGAREKPISAFVMRTPGMVARHCVITRCPGAARSRAANRNPVDRDRHNRHDSVDGSGTCTVPSGYRMSISPCLSRMRIGGTISTLARSTPSHTARFVLVR